jgi:hypothetical protein
MSYEFREYLNKLRQDNNQQYVQDEYNKLDKSKKDEIMKRVQLEIDQLKAKYIIDKRNSQQIDINNEKRREYANTSETNNERMYQIPPDHLLLRSQSEQEIPCYCEDDEAFEDLSMGVEEMGGSDIIDRAKNNLSRLRSEIDELDQYDVNNMPANRKSAKE